MTDTRTVNLVVAGLIGALALSVAGIIALAWTGHQAPETLNALALTSLGALASVLASTRSRNGEGGTK